AMQPPGAILQHELEDGLRSLRVGFETLGDDAPARGRCFARLQFANGLEMPPILVAAGPMEQQIFNAEQAQPRQLRDPFRPDARQLLKWSGKRRVRRRHGPRYRGSNRRRKARSPRSWKLIRS